MRLRITDWKHAWFESHISDRFFQEMSKLERGSAQGLESSAQWMEQIMIEVGSLAQAMIRLEQDGAPEPQIRQAYEKSMRLAALALHLITALDGADREKLRSSTIVRHERGIPNMAVPQAPAVQSAPAASTSPSPPAEAPAVPRPAVPWRPPIAPARAVRKSAQAEPPKTAPVPGPEATASGDSTPEAMAFSSLLQLSGRGQVRSESAAHQTILALDQQGLSRAEIEAVTGEPRHIVEAVLNNARSKAQGGHRSA